VLIDVTDPAMQPVYDPLRCLIYTAADRVVRDVYVDGLQVVADHRVLNLDFHEAADHVSDTQRRILEKVPSRDHQGRRADELSPLTFPPRRWLTAPRRVQFLLPRNGACGNVLSLFDVRQY
jgi:hypothetical protein